MFSAAAASQKDEGSLRHKAEFSACCFSYNEAEAELADKGEILMQIYQVNLQCFHLEEMCAFYTEVLEMELIHQTERWFSVRAGSTKLFFEKGGTVPFYIFASGQMQLILIIFIAGLEQKAACFLMKKVNTAFFGKGSRLISLIRTAIYWSALSVRHPAAKQPGAGMMWGKSASLQLTLPECRQS